MKAVQIFSDEYLAQCAEMTPDDTARFLDEFRIIHGAKISAEKKSKLISIKIPVSLLAAFKTKAALQNERYQTKIKQLMTDWVLDKR
ncbi:MAG: hypothetical protein HKN85_07465 [Gammaproteobacteria bacterium]|nr:hypothetical protein [Gammaproteobacteria bacterium]